MTVNAISTPWSDDDTRAFMGYCDQAVELCEDIFSKDLAERQAETIIDYYNSQRLAGEDPEKVLNRFHNKLTRLQMKQPNKRPTGQE